jgi:hypothetical protein
MVSAEVSELSLIVGLLENIGLARIPFSRYSRNDPISRADDVTTLLGINPSMNVHHGPALSAMTITRNVRASKVSNYLALLFFPVEAFVLRVIPVFHPQACINHNRLFAKFHNSCLSLSLVQLLAFTRTLAGSGHL